ncbi:MAG: serine/threonine-protein kinase [Thermoguttaceae bacterium]
MTLLKEGQKLRETYDVERFLGEGAFAEVYRVQHCFLGRQAMKVLKIPGVTVCEIEQMLGEALLLSRIGHPNVIRVFDANVLEMAGGQFGFFTMEYVAGGSLDRFWRSYRDNLMPVEQAIEVMKQVCAGITVAHAEDPPVVHRDIKPQNILVGYDGAGLRVRVSDFGLAKRVNPLTLLVSAKGTLSFKPPESFENQDSPAADVWALGTTLYLLLTDTLPYPELDERDVADAKRFVRPLRPASVYNLAVDSALDSILSRCLACRPTDRYPDASSLLKDLTRWRPGRPDISSSPTTNVQPRESKSAMGMPSPTDASAAENMVRSALTMAKNPGSLMSAADLLEEAINKAPELQERYQPQLKLWRRGICM